MPGPKILSSTTDPRFERGTGSSRPFLSLRNATFRLGDRLVFQNTSWVIREAEQWAILGENGSGKSLLGDAIRGQLPLVGGELTYHFRPPTASLRHEIPGSIPTDVIPPEDAIGHVSFDDRKQELRDTVLQSRWNSLEEESSLSVAEYLAYEKVMQINPFELRPDDTSERLGFKRRLHRAVDLLGIGKFKCRALLSLSNGERQRVELARALCRPLRLVILDEPFLGLDAPSRMEFSALLERLMSTRLRVLLITNRTADLPRTVSHVLEVSGCAVRSSGPLRSRPELPRNVPHEASTSRLLMTSVRPGRPSHGKTAVKPTLLHPAPTRSTSGPAAEPIVELRNVVVRYGKDVILNRINWRVRRGESWALLGRNGSGKSTLLSLISGDHPQAYNNEVRVFGRRRGTGESVWELKRRIGQVSPEMHLHFDETISCLSVVASGFAGTVGVFDPPAPRQLRVARRLLTEFGLPECAQTPLFGLSTGLQRMVLLARALVSEPELLLLDEPCQGLDSAHRRLFIGTIDKLIRQHKATIIYVTHRDDELPRSIKQVFRLGV